MADNKFPADPMIDLRALQRTVDELVAAVSRRSLATASAGWVLPDRATPPNPDGGVHIYGNAGDLAVLTSAGRIKRIPNPGAAVATPAVMSAGSAPPSYSQTHSDQLRADIAELRTVLVLLLTSLRAAGIILT
ncbi:hypothetical protein [Streptosporangium sandarakinum]